MELGLQNAKEMAGINFGYNEQAADNAAGRSKDLAKFNQELGLDTAAQLWDKYNSPAAKAKAYREAGMNPGLAITGAGSGGTIGTSSQGGAAPQGGTSGPSAGGAAIGQGIQLGLGKIASEAALNAALAKKANEEAKTIAGENTRGRTEIENLAAQTDNERAKRRLTIAQENLTNAQKTAQEIQNKYNKETYWDNVEIVRWHLLEAREDAEAAILRNEITEESKEAIINNYWAQWQKTCAETIGIQAQTGLTLQQAEKVAQEVANILKDMEMKGEQIKNLKIERISEIVDTALNVAGFAKDIIRYHKESLTRGVGMLLGAAKNFI